MAEGLTREVVVVVGDHIVDIGEIHVVSDSGELK